MSIRTKVALVIALSVLVPLALSTAFWVWTLRHIVAEDVSWDLLLRSRRKVEAALARVVLGGRHEPDGAQRAGDRRGRGTSRRRPRRGRRGPGPGSVPRRRTGDQGLPGHRGGLPQAPSRQHRGAAGWRRGRAPRVPRRRGVERAGGRGRTGARRSRRAGRHPAGRRHAGGTVLVTSRTDDGRRVARLGHLRPAAVRASTEPARTGLARRARRARRHGSSTRSTSGRAVSTPSRSARCRCGHDHTDHDFAGGTGRVSTIPCASRTAPSS